MTTHAEWLQQNLQYTNKDFKMSPFGVKVANIIGAVYEGIYHLGTTSYKHPRTNWNAERYIEMVISDHGFSTWDRNDLTKLIILCHDHQIRLEIKAIAPRYMKLCFAQRVKIEEAGDMPIAHGHPSIEEQTAKVRKGFYGE